MERNSFTLIELLVVISIIGLLSSIIFISVNNVRTRAQDAKKIVDLKQVQKAVEMYYYDNSEYPGRTLSLGLAYTTSSSCGYQWCDLKNLLSPYIAELPNPGPGVWYEADAGDNYQSYGLMIQLKDSSNNNLADNDGGYFGNLLYEIGPQPSYCMNKYSGTNRRWQGVQTTVCAGGN